MKILIAGYGEIGQAFRKCLDKHKVLILDPAKGFKPLSISFDILLVCFPFNNHTFYDKVEEYQRIYTPTYTVIASTVPVGCSGILEAIHSPVEGRHPDLEKSLRSSVRWLSGPVTLELADAFDFGGGVEVCERQEVTELAKLLSTAVYAVNIEFARYMKECCDHMGIDYTHIKNFFKDYNVLYQSLGQPGLQKYVLEPPVGKIGGHCVLPNACMLQTDFPSNLVHHVIHTNRKLDDTFDKTN